MKSMRFAGSSGGAGLAVGGLLLLAACSGGGGTAAPSASATPYGTVLGQALEPVDSGLGKAAAATTPADLAKALGVVGSSAGRAARSLNSAVTPAGAEAARTDLVNALEALTLETSALSADIWSKKLCGLGVAQARLGAGQALQGVSAALAKLTTAGYRTAFTVPQLPAPQPQPRSLENGTMVREGGKGGKGTLKFDNQGSNDAVFTLAQGGKSVASVYAAKGRLATVEGVEDGSYDFYYTTGVDWDSEAKQFTENRQFIKYQESYAFTPSVAAWNVVIGVNDGKGGAKIEGQTVNSAPQP
ncbi:hypothetical protein [Kitasatospora sp. NPDC057738]|uniref:hypothetical protein n=1 Tax=Kitasatospora sp. NPDC057738 TaxID=3346233 RepID=UPI0036B05933